MNIIYSTYHLIRKKRFFSIFYWLLDLYRIWYRRPPLPISLTIEPNNNCNLRCPTCPTGSGCLSRPKRMMSLDEFKNIIDKVDKSVSVINLYGYGEPFLNPDILSMIKYAVDKKIIVKMSSNGQFFSSKDYCINMVKSGLQNLIISLDGIDQKTIDKFRINADFNKIIDSIMLLKEAKDELGSETPKIELQVLIMKQNENQLNDLKLLAEELGVDTYRQKLLGLDSGSADFEDLAEKLLPKNNDLCRYYRDDGGKLRLKGERVNRCLSILNSTMIMADGSVVPCCYDWDGHYIMGNIFESNLRSIWHGSKYRSFRKVVFNDRRRISMCNICPEGRQKITKKTDIKIK